MTLVGFGSPAVVVVVGVEKVCGFKFLPGPKELLQSRIRDAFNRKSPAKEMKIAFVCKLSHSFRAHNFDYICARVPGAGFHRRRQL